jgi:membrane-associated protease RseP (regulator of RpoE activity)
VQPRPVEKLGIGGAIVAVPGETVRFVGQSAQALGGLFTPNGIGDMTSNVTNAQRDRAAESSGSAPSAEQTDREQHRLVSIFGVIQLGGAAAGQANGFAFLLLLFFQMNIFIGIFNMLPLPPLDGGHAAVAIYERARSRQGRRYYADARKLLPLTYAVVMGLVVLGVATMYLDIVNPINT